jgi:4-aminobutyrate aminotransferase
MNSEEVLKKQEEYLWPSHLTLYKEPLVLARGEGMHLYDTEGNAYLDCFGGILTISVGHCHPKVTEALKKQIEMLVHTSTLYPNEKPVLLAEKLAEITPGNLKKSYFTNSGTEAIENAIMLAKQYTGAQEVITLRHSYHGRSALAMSLLGLGQWRVGGTHVAGIRHALAPYCYRCPLKLSYPSCGIACAHDVEELILTTTSGRVAAFLAEPVLGVGGYVDPPREYYGIVADIVRKYGGVFISDEVQTAFGRTGGKWFGIEHWGVEPEIMTMAKGIANGTPLGATIATPEVADSMKGLTISTFGGNPVSCVAGIATLEVIAEECPPEHVQEVGDHLKEGLEVLYQKYPVIGEVRGMGLMQGIEIVKDRDSKEPALEVVADVFEVTRESGLLTGKAGMLGNVLRIAPPMVATKDNIDQAVEIFDYAFAKVLD